MSNMTSSSTSPFTLARQNVDSLNVTGDGTVYQVIYNNQQQGGNFDNVTGTFTCTVAGMFLFVVGQEATGLSVSATAGVSQLVTTQGSYTFANLNFGAWRSAVNVCQAVGTIIAPMAVGDTAYSTMQISNTTKTVDSGNGVPRFIAWRLY